VIFSLLAMVVSLLALTTSVLLLVVARRGALAALTNARQASAGQEMPSPAVCGCGHMRSMHAPKRNATPGACNVRTYRAGTGYDCPCLQYEGPEPLPTYFAPEL
jgi:hypothetical protein